MGVVALRMNRQTTAFGALASVDFDELGCGNFRYQNSYTSAARLDWTCIKPEYEFPFDKGDFVTFWDDDSPQTQASPIFEGYVEEVTPGSHANEVKVTAFDPSYRAARSVVVMSAAWEVVSGQLSEGDASYPRFVANTQNFFDEDYAYSSVQAGTVGDIIKKILDDQKEALYFSNAAPGNGSVGGSATPYDAGDLSGTAFIPQEKFVATAESVPSAIDRLIAQYEPSWRQTWVAGERRFRFSDITDLPRENITINDSTQDYPVSTIKIVRSLEGRYTSVKFYGPESVEWKEAVCTYPAAGSDTLQDTSTFGTIGQAPDTGTCRHHWTIVDPNFNRIANRGNSPVQVPSPVVQLYSTSANSDELFIAQQNYVDWWTPTLQVKYADGEGGDDRWYMQGGWRMDAFDGVIELTSGCLYRWWEDSPSSSIVEPDEVKFVYPNMVGPLTLRYPATGYQGTAYDVAGLENTLRIYDEDLAIYDTGGVGVPETDQERIDKFQAMAETILKERQDIIYAGGINLDGLDYKWKDLRKAVNFLALDDNGQPIDTGWQSVGAVLTDVEYDFEEQLTTLTFSSDKFDLAGIDPEQLKEELGFRERERQIIFTESLIYSSENSGSGTIFSAGQGLLGSVRDVFSS